MNFFNPLIKHTWMYSPSIIIGPSLRIDHPKLHHKPSHRWNISTRFASIWCIFIYFKEFISRNRRENFMTKKVNHGWIRNSPESQSQILKRLPQPDCRPDMFNFDLLRYSAGKLDKIIFLAGFDFFLSLMYCFVRQFN